MNTNLKSNPLVGQLLFFAGILLGAVLAGGLIWSDVEAVFYGFPNLTNQSFGGLRCPALMTRSETATLQVVLHNETERPISPLVRVEMSAPGPMFSIREKTPLMQPAETVSLEFSVSQENIDLGFFIFAKAFRYPDYRTPLAEDTCGILVLDFPFLNGKVLMALWLGLSILSTLAGLWILEKQKSVISHRASMRAAFRGLAIAMLTGVLLAIQGAWLPGMAVLVIMVLFVLALLYFRLAH